MSSEIIIALLGFLGTACGSMVGAIATSKLTNYRLEQLEKKVDNLSNHAERIALLEHNGRLIDVRISEIESKIK